MAMRVWTRALSVTSLALLVASACEVEMNVPVEPLRDDDDDDGSDEGMPLPCSAPADCQPDGGRPFCSDAGLCVECLRNADCDPDEVCEYDRDDMEWECEGDGRR